MIRLAAALVLVAPSLVAGAPSARAQATLVVEALEGTVVVDGEARGAPGTALAVEPGARAVWLVDRVGAWNPRVDSVRVALAAGDTARVALALPTRTRIETRPRGAAVAIVRPDGSRQRVGTAPLAVDLPPGSLAEVEVSLPGYATVRRAVGERPALEVVLAPEPGVRTPPDVQTFATRRASRRRTLVDLGIGAATLAAGAVAVYYKFEADSVDDRYRDSESLQRGDEALRQEALRLDRRSAVALGAMQVGVGVLAIRFVLR